ncbi:hypothetical protein C0Q70_03596 [Pomacea canaliculata]|uniref:Uncharacterized protein n=1 Tax=Pomacea canaliculata TaxID=400727 RepID=A0A2T7PT61_POMCA|nr:hypothetical protein C0Q70_03596 [Pomacea canaliculata]
MVSAKGEEEDSSHHLDKRQSVYNSKDSSDLAGSWCYQCKDATSNDSACAVGSFLLSSQATARSRIARNEHGIRGNGIVNCGVWFEYCMIQEIFLGAKNGSSSFSRDCSDGKQFSFDVKNIQKEYSSIDNRTRCWFDAHLKGQVCLSLCQGDFCNGPVYPTASSASQTFSKSCVLALLIVLFCASLV